MLKAESFDGVLVLDGGLATELEARGHDLSDALWSARLLVDAPEVIEAVHYDYLLAGADVVIAATYQATVAGFVRWGLSESEAVAALQRSVDLAVAARDRFWRDPSNQMGRRRPLVAASVGPYGAFLANGAEYTGDYDLDEAGLLDWHRGRWHLLANSGAEVLSAETIPSHAEAAAILTLSNETNIPTWVSFSCKDEKHISDGTPIAECGRLLSSAENIIAIGINCTKPRFVEPLIDELRAVTDKRIVVYPNSGEAWVNRQWVESAEGSAENFADLATRWHAAGATLIGGCCRTGPDHVRHIRERIKAKG